MKSWVMINSDQRGITLTELLVTLSLMVLILSALFSIFSEGIKSYSRDIAEVGMQLDLKLAGEKWRREIRTSQYGFFENKEYPYTEEKKLFLLAGDKQHPQIISYSLEEGTLLRNSEGTSQLVVKQVENVEFHITQEPHDQPIVEMKIVYKENLPYQNNPITKQWNLQVTPRFKFN